MSKICPNCQEVFDDSHGFCSNCGSRLVDNDNVNPALNIGDANAISGGVNINQSKTITSHDTHYHTTTVQERSKSESELKLDANNQLRAKAEVIMTERGRIDSEAMSQLRPFATQLGIDDETFKTIIKDVRTSRNGGIVGLSSADTRYLKQAQQALIANDMDTLSNLTHRLEAMASISQDENVQFLYYLTLALQYPIKSIEVYERQVDENYWRTFWAIISYIRTGNPNAERVLPSFLPTRYEKSEEDRNLLEAYFSIMKGNKDDAQDFLDDILGEPTEQIKPLLQAIESKIYEEDTDNRAVKFYIERVLVRSEEVVKKKKIETQVEAKALTEDEAKALYDAVDTGSDPSKIKELQKLAEAGDVWAMFYYARLYTMSNCVKRNFELAVDYYTKAANAGNAPAMNSLANRYQRGEGVIQNLTEAIKWYRRGADAGNAWAMYNLGILYENGFGVNQDYSEAVKWYSNAAELGHTYAIGKLGLCYEKGQGVEKDYNEAVKWYRKAADKGDVIAMINLGGCYMNGYGVNRNLSEAATLFKKAAELDNPDAMLMVGVFYQKGYGVNQNSEEAFKWYKKASEKGNAVAMNKLGSCYKNGDGVDQNSLEAVKWYTKAADLGNVDAMFKLGSCYENGNGVNQNFTEAVKWYHKAADGGNVRAMGQLGWLYEKGIAVNQDYAEAAKWYQKCADKGNITAIVSLGLLYLNGKGVNQNDNEAYKLFWKGADAGNLTAMTNLGWCYEFGRGVEPNPVEAMNWYQKALDNGFQMDEWLSKRMEECKLKLPSNVEVIFNNAWATAPNDINTDKWNIYLHLHFQINHCNNRKLYIRFTTELSNDNNDSTGIILSIIDDECIPNYDFCEWKDYIHWINEGAQNWPNNDSNMRLKTTIQVLDENKNPLSTNTYWITYNVFHKIRLFHGNELYLA